MNKDCKVIILDVDGTLLNSKREISLQTKEALLKAQREGCLLVIASGRPTPALYELVKELEMDKHHGFVVSYNGGRVSDATTNEILFNQSLSVEEGKAILNHMKKFDVIPMIDKEDYMYVNDVYNCMIDYNGGMNIIDYEARAANYKLCEKEDLEAFLDYEINKVLTAANPSYLQEHYQEMMEPFKDTLNCMFTAPFYFEFTAKGIDKANALEKVLIPLGYKRENMIAFGDAQNDASMISFVKMGIAMGNATQELKDIAQMVTLSNDEDGIAYALNKIL